MINLKSTFCEDKEKQNIMQEILSNRKKSYKFS